jgi:G:T/U-mismatch repair DNA glycosylase
MKDHPFSPLIPEGSRKLLVGTLPPESARFYFSNSSNTRLWDILRSIYHGSDEVYHGSNDLNENEKRKILNKLNIGITDIILKYERIFPDSTKDIHIIPKEYKDLIKTAIDNNIGELLFVYNTAYKWFIHSLTKEKPVRIRRLKEKYKLGLRREITFGDKTIKCILLPAPLNRGRRGETLEYKLQFYKDHII